MPRVQVMKKDSHSHMTKLFT